MRKHGASCCDADRTACLNHLTNHPEFGERIRQGDKRPLASVAELKAAGITFHPNQKSVIDSPRNPISAGLSNLYLVQLDAELSAYADSIGGFYRRHSDDILFICHSDDATTAEQKIQKLVASEGLMLNDGKTERTRFSHCDDDVASSRSAQYLGFTLGSQGVAIRQSSLSRQWRKMRRAIKRTRNAAEIALASGASKQVFTKRLRRRFTAVAARNFPSYARRSAATFSGSSIIASASQLREGVGARDPRTKETWFGQRAFSASCAGYDLGS